MIRLVYIAILVATVFTAHGQDFYFSQHDVNPINFNPASTGYYTNMRLGFNYRNHWLNTPPGSKFPGPFSTYNTYADIQLGNESLHGLGLSFNESVQGEGFLKTSSGSLAYAFHLTSGRPFSSNGSKFNISLGASSSFNQVRLDYSSLIFSDQVDADLGYLNTPSSYNPSNTNGRFYADFAVGTLIRWYPSIGRKKPQSLSNEFSYTVSHFPRPIVSLNDIGTRLPIKYSFSYANSFAPGANWISLNPRIVFESHGGSNLLSVGMNIYFKIDSSKLSETVAPFYRQLYFIFNYHEGGFNLARNVSGIAVGVGFTNWVARSKGPRYQLSLLYDASLSGSDQYLGGSLELSVTFILPADYAFGRSNRCTHKNRNRYKPNLLSPVN